MLLIPNALCWLSRKCNRACALPAEVQLRLRVTRRSWQKLFAGKNFVKILVTAQTQLRSYSEQQRAFGNSNICNWFRVQNPAPVGPLVNDFKIQVRLSNLVRSTIKHLDLRYPMARRVETVLGYVQLSSPDIV